MAAAPVVHHATLVEVLHDEWRRAAETAAWVALALVQSEHPDPRLLVALRWVLSRRCDILVRTGESEFGVIFPHTKFRGAQMVIDRLSSVVAALEPHESGTQPTFESGVSAYPAAGDHSYFLLLDDAHDALQQAKTPRPPHNART